MLDNKLGITNEIELVKEEERITKLKALELFDTNKINEIEVGTIKGLSEIHKYLFSEIYDFAGKIREVNIAKGNFRFVPAIYLEEALEKIDNMPQDSFDNIIKKYIEMNVEIKNLNDTYAKFDFNSTIGVQAILQDGTAYTLSNNVSFEEYTDIQPNMTIKKNFVFEIPAQLQEGLEYILFNDVSIKFSKVDLKFNI